MNWKSMGALLEENRGQTFLDRFARVYSIRRFILNGIRTDPYAVRQNAMAGVVFTAAGEQLLDEFSKAHKELSQEQVRFVVFLVQFHEHLFVDLELTNTENLEAALNEDILAGHMRYPWFFDHILYDKAFRLFKEMPERLSVSETEELLKDTTPGVYQSGRLLVGPFGLLESTEKRKFAPTLNLLLSHCDDQDCNATLSISHNCRNQTLFSRPL